MVIIMLIIMNNDDADHNGDNDHDDNDHDDRHVNGGIVPLA